MRFVDPNALGFCYNSDNKAMAFVFLGEILHKLYSLILVLLISLPSSADEKSLRAYYEGISQQITNVIKQSRIPKSELGIWVGQSHVGAGNFFELNSSKLFIPASLTKILTSYASFKSFTLEHKFKTELLSSAKVKGDVLTGDLYLKGGGDPSFVSQSLWVLVNHFVRTGIKTVAGNIIVDDSIFDSVRYDKSREDRRVDRAYDAPVSAMSFNWNSVNVYVRPAKKLGKPAIIFADPISPYITIVNKTRTVKGKVKKLRVSRIRSVDKPGDTVIVAGSIGINKDEQVYYKSITQPALWSGYHLIEFLKQRGIEVKGKVQQGITPVEANVLADFESSDIRKVIADMMKFSNNYVAEMLTKNIAAIKTNKPGAIPDGIKEIRRLLEDNLGYSPEHYHLINPSGLTRKNRFRPRDFATLLNSAKSDFQYFPEFIASMPISGIDGTLKDRFSSEVDLKVRAKTGLLNGVTGLAGYLEQPNGKVLTFVFMYNGTQGRINRAALLFENIIKTMSFDRFIGKNN